MGAQQICGTEIESSAVAEGHRSSRRQQELLGINNRHWVSISHKHRVAIPATCQMTCSVNRTRARKGVP